jgi:dolichol-phosphate mannosyltransferase
MLALFLRGGLLASMVEFTGGSITAAIIISVCISTMVMLTGLSLQHHSLKEIGNGQGGGRNLTIAIIIYMVLLRLFYGGPFELLHEEGYYWNYAQHLDIGYLDHPPMVGWLIWIFTTLFGHSEFTVRIGAFVCWVIMGYYAHKLTSILYNNRVALNVLLVVAVLPVFFCIDLFMMPDAPLLASWAGALYYLYCSLIEEKRAAWLGVGVFMGLGMLSKYTIALLGGATLLYMLFNGRSRKWLFRPDPYLAFLFVILIFSPVIIWNAQHDWASFIFQGPRRFKGGFDFDLPDMAGAVLILLTPVGLAAAVATVTSGKMLVHERTGTKGKRAYGLLLTLTLFPLSVFVFFSLYRNIKLNWTAPLWLGVLPYMGAIMAAGDGKPYGIWAALARRTWPGTVIVMPFLYGALLHYLVLGFPGAPYLMNQLGTGMHDLAKQVETIADGFERETGEKPFIVCMDRDRIAGWVAFYRTKIAKSKQRSKVRDIVDNTTGGHFFGENTHMYELWHPPQMHRDRVIMLISNTSLDMEGGHIKSRAEPITDVKKLVFRKNGKVAGRYFYRFLREGKKSSPGSRFSEDQPGRPRASREIFNLIKMQKRTIYEWVIDRVIDILHGIGQNEASCLAWRTAAKKW